jgi:hypothetical protein
MNFLPRSVAIGPNSMGNKLYKVHVRHESGEQFSAVQWKESHSVQCSGVTPLSAKETLSVAPDSSIGQLKGLIGAKFQVIIQR